MQPTLVLALLVLFASISSLANKLERLTHLLKTKSTLEVTHKFKAELLQVETKTTSRQDKIPLSFTQKYNNPIVITSLVTANGGDPFVYSVNSLSSSGHLRLLEWPYLDGAHGAAEVCQYLVLEAGRHVLADGSWIEAGTATIRGKESKTTIELMGNHAVTDPSDALPGRVPPIVLTTLKDADEAVAVRLEEISGRRFTAWAQKQSTQVHEPVESTDIYWVAFSYGIHRYFEARSLTTSHVAATLEYEFGGRPFVFAGLQSVHGGDTAWARLRLPTERSVVAWTGEEKSNKEAEHVAEQIGVVSLKESPEKWDELYDKPADKK